MLRELFLFDIAFCFNWTILCLIQFRTPRPLELIKTITPRSSELTRHILIGTRSVVPHASSTIEKGKANQRASEIVDQRWAIYHTVRKESLKFEVLKTVTATARCTS